MTIGIVGGGQLAKMMAQKAKKIGLDTVVLDPTPNCPAAQVGSRQIAGDFYDGNKLRELVGKSDVTTYDTEHMNTRVLRELVREGNRIYPSPALLETIQDKLQQKDALARAGIAVPRYGEVGKLTPLDVERFGFPCVQKARKGGVMMAEESLFSRIRVIWKERSWPSLCWRNSLTLKKS